MANRCAESNFKSLSGQEPHQRHSCPPFPGSILGGLVVPEPDFKSLAVLHLLVGSLKDIWSAIVTKGSASHILNSYTEIMKHFLAGNFLYDIFIKFNNLGVLWKSQDVQSPNLSWELSSDQDFMEKTGNSVQKMKGRVLYFEFPFLM